jgi:hypothetical protein
MSRVTHWRRAVVLLAAVGLVATACGSSSNKSSGASGATTTTAAPAAAAAASDLTGVCPNPLIVQTDWFPEPEQGGLYQLIGPGGKQDAKKGVYSGPLGDTGITLEIRAGGPFLGGQSTTAQLYSDQNIFMGYVATDEAVKMSGKQPTVAVVSPLEKSPQILMWDPAAFPNVKTWADVKPTKAKVLYFEGSAYMDYLIGKGLVDKKQTDASYDGSPTRFVTEHVFQQGFSSNEPFTYENDIPQWKKPVKYLYVDDAGYKFYPSSLSVRPELLTKNADCLKKVVPMMQQAQVDYMADPKPINDFFLSYVKAMASFWVLTAPGEANAVKVMLADKLVSNGPDSTLGNFDMDRVQKFIDDTLAIFKGVGITSIKDGVKASDVVTNQFIDPSIGLK